MGESFRNSSLETVKWTLFTNWPRLEKTFRSKVNSREASTMTPTVLLESLLAELAGTGNMRQHEPLAEPAVTTTPGASDMIHWRPSVEGSTEGVLATSLWG